MTLVIEGGDNEFGKRQQACASNLITKYKNTHLKVVSAVLMWLAFKGHLNDSFSWAMGSLWRKNSSKHRAPIVRQSCAL